MKIRNSVYEQPKVKIITFSERDVIATSDGFDGEDQPLFPLSAPKSISSDWTSGNKDW